MSSSCDRGFSSEELLSLRFPLHRACRDGDLLLLRSLLALPATADLTLEDNFYGWTPLHWAAHFGKLECTMQLVHAGAGVNTTTTRFAQTPTHIAAFGGHPQSLLWLIQAGADYNIQDYVGESPIHKAARSGSLECLNVLVSHGAKADLRNANGLTAADLALAQGFNECSQFLSNLQNYHLNGSYTNGISNEFYQHTFTSGLNGYSATNRKRTHEDAEHAAVKKPRTEGMATDISAVDDLESMYTEFKPPAISDTNLSSFMEKMLTNGNSTNGQLHDFSSAQVNGMGNLSTELSACNGMVNHIGLTTCNGSGFQSNGVTNGIGNAEESSQSCMEMCGSLHQNGSPSSCVALKPTWPSNHAVDVEGEGDPLQYSYYHGFGDTAESIPDFNSAMEHSNSIKVEELYDSAVYSAVHLFHGS
ncbi:ankyrin repeat domain-containing protein 10 isoform X1 [Callorhinchus milii]|uniref:Ankyrin repeat domain 10a n=1 Tax=Callorhinchus milii TaxID=7868 RepID=A0A4W3JH68_CALMI|nr:ankyrin repeat domain-containing protein 10 isoform X1 [Callorhinchus milii]|eukprot:gi/632949099/ref/XP_007889959.1/ PREDICTED: ankyrin repeat domain-containing protein 10 isoform X1 [Callorhinchus milii]